MPGSWWFRDWAAAAAGQVRAIGDAAAGSDRFRDGDGDAQPVVVLPGIYETWAFLRPLIDALHDDGHPVFVVDALRYNLRPIPDSARAAMDLVEQEQLTDVLLVAHSKGGLIGKYAMTSLDPDGRIDRMIAIASPFGGSWYADYVPVRHLRAFRAADPVLVALARELDVNARITSIAAARDSLVPNGSELAGATNVRLPVDGHFRILEDPRAIRTVVEAARR